MEQKMFSQQNLSYDNSAEMEMSETPRVSVVVRPPLSEKIHAMPNTVMDTQVGEEHENLTSARSK
jgi:hypothetical protein